MATRSSRSLNRVAVRQAATAIAAMVGFSLIATSAFAQAPIPPQNIPSPKAAPKNRDGAQDGQRGPTTTGATQVPPTPFIPDPRRSLPLSIFATFDDKQKAQAARISSSLSSLQTLVGNFVQ